MHDGGYAEYATLRTEGITRVPNGMDPALVAPLLCAGVTTFSKLQQVASHRTLRLSDKFLC